MRWPHSITFVLGVWLAVAPFPLDYSGIKAAVSNDFVVGLAIAILSIWHVGFKGHRSTGWLNWGIILLGTWVFLAPFILGYHNIGAAGTNGIIVGFAVISLTWMGGAMTEYVIGSPSGRSREDRNYRLAGRILLDDWATTESDENSERRL